MKVLNLGCGQKIQRINLQGEIDDWAGKDVIHVDNNEHHKPDYIVDLTQHPLPFDDNEFDEIHAYDVLEHLADQGDYKFFFNEFSEYWRILKPGGYFCAIVPAYPGKWAWGDPSHRRVITAENLIFLNQQTYIDQVGKTAISDFRYIYKADFRPVRVMKEGDSFIFVLKAVK